MPDVLSSCRRVLLGIACALLAPLASACAIQPPAVPANLRVAARHEPSLIAQAIGAQNDMCLPSSDSGNTAFVPYDTDYVFHPTE